MNISEGEHFMKKTKIICTLGPSTDKKELLVDMIRSGMDLARFNFSHGSHSECEARLNLLKEAEKEAGRLVGYVADTKGPEMRLGLFKGDKTTLVPGHEFILTTEDVEGTAEKAHVNYAGLPEEVKRGDTILLNDGKLSLEVQSTTDKEIHTIVVNGGEISSRKRVAVPGAFLKLPFLSDADISDITFAAQHGMTYVAASFVRNAHDAMEIRRLLEKLGSPMGIIAKIENREGVSNLPDILNVADGIMVARGDMGVEIDFTEIPVIQKDMIAQCVACGKPVITATQMLDSMIENPRPTRAEITDVANAIYDGTSAIMLSGETAAGKYPVEAVHTMDAIARRTEANIDRAKPLKVSGKERLSVTTAMAHAACTTAMDIGADAILTVSQRGVTAQMVSRFRPRTTIVALLLDEQVRRQMALYWGVEPVTMPYASNTDELVEFAVTAAEKAGIVHQGDLVVVTAGVPVGVAGTTNMIRVQQVGGSLINAIGIGDKKASGRLCVCRTLEEVAEKFREGDVLVVPYTTNDLLPYIRQASAVISEEASADCHTATVGLTLDKPVIVGAADATRRLKDGTRVSVDCVRGVVQTLPE